MSLLESKPLTLLSKMPEFELSDPFGEVHKTQTLMGSKGLLIIFTCNHCPYAIAIWDRLVKLSEKLLKQGVSTVAINPNIHPSYPDDSPQNMALKIEEWGIPFPYLVDIHQNVANQYQAECTPDIYFITPSNQLIYHGRLDDNWRNSEAVTNHELQKAIDLYLLEGTLTQPQNPSMGCSIKWCE